ncbi:MAG TPA: HAD family acid phosphatase [Thermoanaerobaculia bacterium]|nr:HAD family acid phosphatase [Thermoanaerobaculia bacterium]
MRSPLSSLRVVFLLPLSFVACAPATPAPKVAAGAAAAAATPGVPTDELHWLRNSAEYRAITIQTYRLALEAAAEAGAGRPVGSWGVSVDADETILDNSTYEVELQRQGLVHTDAAWKAWVKRGERTAVPGAATFLASVQKLGGRVAVVTNTVQSLCPEVAANLRALSLPYDILVCRADDGEDRKEGRWRSVADGTARPDLGPVEILVWVGDNIQDFPDQSQALCSQPESAFSDFGVRFFALPNPIYGTWEKNPPR